MRVALLAAALALAGCTSLIPRYERPEPPVAATYTADLLPGGAGTTAAADIPWQTFFGDARLRTLIQVALDNNRDLRASALAIERARALYNVQRASGFPTVGVGVGGQLQPNPKELGGGTSQLYTAGLAVPSWEIDFFGRIRSLSEAALAQFLATEEARRAAQISLIAAVANTYFAALADDELLAVTEQTLATREETLRLTRLRFDVGASSEFELRQAESLLESARATLAQQVRQRALDENALVLLLGQPVPADLPPGLRLADQQLVTDLPAGLPSELLTRRPDIRQAEQLLLSANANIGAARAAFFPSISLTGSVGVASTRLGSLFTNGTFAWSVAPQMLLPIFDAGRNRANLAVAEADRDLALARYERSIQTAFREVSDALAGRATLTEQVRALNAQSNAEAVRFRLADLRYRSGASSFLDVLDAQRALFQVQQAALQVRAAQVQNLVTLYQVLGGGWTDPASAPPADAAAGSAGGTPAAAPTSATATPKPVPMPGALPPGTETRLPSNPVPPAPAR
ncbi:efflux transporter outer membrane subunit [Schlegelella sp. ID0723]|uniref:Efflux transporter outer membrane subunit n=2 Tax=Piscinibacter koreensis TaxID=2742824 RepID=A0A7Y6NK04_9BURK|nr:efflux transporter outer membrane subunit [Schlegelella koreensis]